MKILTIHRLDRGAANDFCFGIEGELCIPLITDCENPECGCDRAMVGLNSAKASTTVRVTEVDIDHNDAAFAVTAYMSDAGWSALFESGAEMLNAATGFVLANVKVAERYPEGTVLRPHYDREANTWTFTEAGI